MVSSIENDWKVVVTKMNLTGKKNQVNILIKSDSGVTIGSRKKFSSLIDDSLTKEEIKSA